MPSHETDRFGPRLQYAELFSAARELLGREYWLFTGIAAVGYLIAGFVPLYLCYGPMLCGVYYTFRRKQAGEHVEFVDLFRGFDWFLPSLLVSLAKLGISLVLIGLWAALLFALMFGIGNADLSSDGASTAILLTMVPFYLVLFLAMVVVEAFFLYSFPLVVDRGMAPGEAMRVGAQALRQNLGPSLVIVVLNGLLSLLATLCCFLPFFLVLPIPHGVVWLAYRRIFGEPPVVTVEHDPLGA